MIVWLSVTHFAGTVGGEHFQGRLVAPDGDPYDAEVRRSLTRTDAEALNRKDGTSPFGGSYALGDFSRRFETQRFLYERAVATARETWPEAALIVRGAVGSIPPSDLVWAASTDVARECSQEIDLANRIYGRSPGGDPWAAGFGAEMEALIARWGAIEQSVAGSP